MRRIYPFLYVLMCFAVLPAAGQEKAVAQPVAQPAAAPAAPTPNGKRNFLWEVKSATATAYLFGTVHVGKNSFYPLPDAIETAFLDADRLVVEADITNQQAVNEATPLMLYTAPDSLETKLPAEQLARLKLALKRSNIPFEAVKSLKPFIIGGLLAVTEFGRLGYDQRFGVDAYLIQKAVQRSKPVGELESVAGQMKLLTGLSTEEQGAFLDNALATIEKGRSEEQINGMIYAWQQGDPAHLEKVVADANKGMKLTARLDEKLLYSRNGQMLEKIEGFLAGKDKVFVAVGSMHLVGKRGLVEMLKAKGYAVQQL